MNLEQMNLLHQFLISLGESNTTEPKLDPSQLAAFEAFIGEYNQGSKDRLQLVQLGQAAGLTAHELTKLRELA